MFQRLKGAIDSRIAEEQARQRQAQQAAQGRPAPRRRPPNANSPAQRPSTRSRDATPAPGEKQPDPADFVIGDDDGSSTPAIEKTDPLTKANDVDNEKSEDVAAALVAKAEGPATDAAIKPVDASDISTKTEQPDELPVEVRTKLRRLDKLESKYGELLKAYRAAHARVQNIDPFEAALRENTPLTGIGDPASLVEYLNQIKLKGDMVLDELKRVTTERDDFKKKLEQSEKDATGLKAEMEELKTKTDRQSGSAAEGRVNSTATETADETQSSDVDPKAGSETAAAKSLTSGRIGSFSLFSPRLGTSKDPPKEPDASEDLFSYDSELPRLEQELQERTAEVEDLSQQVVSLRSDLAVARESTSSMVQTLETATRELNALRDERDKFASSRSEYETRISELRHSNDLSSSQAELFQKQIDELTGHKNAAEAEMQKLKTQLEEAQKAKAEVETKLEAQRIDVNIMKEHLSQKDHIVKDLEDSLAAAKLSEREQARKSESETTGERKLATMQGIMETLRTQLSTAEKTVTDLRRAIEAKQEEFASKPSTKIFGYLDERNDPKVTGLKTQSDVLEYLAEHYGLRKDATDSSLVVSTPVPDTNSNAASTKKNKKKKKKAGKGQQTAADDADPDIPVKVSEDLSELVDDVTVPSASPSASIAALETEISMLRAKLEHSTDTIERLSKKIKDQEALQEEIETLRDDLLHQGEEHVEARDALKEARSAHKDTQEVVEKLRTQLEEATKRLEANLNLQKAHTDLNTRFDDLGSKADALQKELGAAESLAASRFKDITDLKELLSKAQPELRQLRSEVAELKAAKEDLKNKEGELKRLESRHEDLKSEMKGLGKRLGDKDLEIKELQTKIEQETKARNKVENELSSAQLDARVAENKRRDTSELLEQRQKDLTQAKEEVTGLRRKINELEDKVSDHNKDIASLKEEVALKTALHSSSQSLLQSLRDQTHELSMQSRESSSRAESLEEELAEAQRMLSERTRESQTMRMLLDQAQNGVEARLREMKERMETALEERDRVEDEANVRDRRLMREVEDARNKMRDAQKRLKALEDERDDLETKNRDWRRQREVLEQQATDAKKDADDLKQATRGLRDALDESERQIQEGEAQRADLRRQIEDTNDRVEKLTRANKNLSEEIKKLQDSGASRKGSLRPAGVADNGPRSSRTSIDSTRSPAPPLVRESSASTGRPMTPSAGREAGGNAGLTQGNVDYVYLKNVLLQFMEQKDKSHQRQLVPVLAMLLHFDRKDEQKWMAAISAR